MKQIDPKQLVVVVTQNQYIPDEGPLVVPIQLDFSKSITFGLEPLLSQQQTRFPSLIQSIYVDTSKTGDLTITVLQTGQVIIAQAGKQGYYTVLSPNPPRMNFTNNSGTDQILIHLFNVAIPGSVWSAS